MESAPEAQQLQPGSPRLQEETGADDLAPAGLGLNCAMSSSHFLSSCARANFRKGNGTQEVAYFTFIVTELTLIFVDRQFQWQMQSSDFFGHSDSGSELLI